MQGRPGGLCGRPQWVLSQANTPSAPVLSVLVDAYLYLLPKSPSSPEYHTITAIRLSSEKGMAHHGSQPEWGPSCGSDQA